MVWLPRVSPLETLRPYSNNSQLDRCPEADIMCIYTHTSTHSFPWQCCSVQITSTEPLLSTSPWGQRDERPTPALSARHSQSCGKDRHTHPSALEGRFPYRAPPHSGEEPQRAGNPCGCLDLHDPRLTLHMAWEAVKGREPRICMFSNSTAFW